MPAPEIIKKLVDQFTQNRESYRSGKYNEAQLRQEFLDPFFEALGWDVYNKNGYSLDYREVVIEDSLDIEGASKSPDYAFKIGKERKFYVEAKKPKVDIQYDIHPAYQLRRYAWNAHLPLSILTDFEELAVYNCKNRPNPQDSAATARDLFFRYTDYVDRWDELAAIFSKEAVLKGAFDRYADSSSGKKGTTEVDDAFLEDIESWRKLLAQNIALRNPQVTDERRLNFAVQMTIDRIIFLRICEDRGIEPDEQLKDLTKAPNIYPRLVELFKRADQKYNSGLFHFAIEKGNDSPADTFTPDLVIDDKIFKEIFKGIYYPCEYIFKEIPVEILGQVYEQFLGKVIHLTAGHQARIEEKPEVRKAGGVYYTPRYIVDYIVANTVGKLLEGKTPAEAAVLKIVDPACGSGSFLLGAYQYLLDWHEKWYLENDPEKWARGKEPPISQVVGGWRLTTRMKKEILVNNIHGVDIDAQAVEVTKLSLLLKVLEGETGQLSLGFERVLPDLGHNIQCGNSLIGEDYFAGRLVVEEEERRRVNPFDWPTAFPQVFAKGGFDAVIGNPPYGANLDKQGKEFLSNRYKNVSDFESSQYFLLRSKDWVKGNGFIAFIVPNTLLLNIFAKKFRNNLLDYFCFISVTNLSNISVFENATVRTVIPLMQNCIGSKLISFIKQTDSGDFIEYNKIEQGLLKVEDENWVYAMGFQQDPILEKIKKGTTNLGALVEVSQGLIPYDKYRGHSEATIKNRIWNANYKKDNTYKKELRGGDITRYKVNWNGKQWISYGPWLAAPRKPEFFTLPRLLFREITDPKTRYIFVAYTEEEFYNNPGIINCIKRSNDYSLYYLLGICASRLISYYHFKSSPKANKGIFPKIIVNDVRNLPIHEIDFLNGRDLNKYEEVVALVTRMLELNKRNPATPQEQLELQRNIAATDRQIDTLVYQLYDLTPEEIAIVEAENK